MNSQKRAIVYVLLCIVFWGLIPLVAKLGQAQLDNHQFLFWSSLSSLLLFIVILIATKRNQKLETLSTKNWIHAILLGLLGTYLYYILLYFGYANTDGLEVLILQYCWPIFVVILSIVILKENINSKKIISILLGFFGVFLILSKGDLTAMNFNNLFVDSIVLLAAFTAGLFSVLSKKISIEPTLLVAIYFLTATISSFISMFYFSEFKLPTISAILPILINGLLVNGLSYLLWVKALKTADASFLAPFVFLTPLLSAVFLIVFFDEPFYSVYIFGLILIVGGGLLNSLSKNT